MSKPIRLEDIEALADLRSDAISEACEARKYGQGDAAEALDDRVDMYERVINILSSLRSL